VKAAPTFAPYELVTYRFTNLEYFETLDSTIGAYSQHNRYTPAGMSHALYVADGPDTALVEATQGYHAQFQARTIPAHAFYPVLITAQHVLDLTSKAVRDQLGTSMSTLTGDWRAALRLHLADPTERVETHEIGRAAFEAGLDGLRYPSAKNPVRHNLVLFTENMAIKPDVHLPPVIVLARQLIIEQRQAKT